jgi:hypothetical protein
VIDYRYGDRWSWGVAIVGINQGQHIVASQYLQHRLLCRLAERVRVTTNIDWAMDVLSSTVFHDCLRNGQDVLFIKRGGEGAAAVTGRAKGHFLGG